MFQFLKRIMADQSGASTADYAILLGAITAASFASVSLFGSGLSGLVESVSNKLVTYAGS